MAAKMFKLPKININKLLAKATNIPPTPLMDSIVTLKGENNRRTRSWGTFLGL